jgi:ATP-binding cassette subfamily F protein 3
MRQREFRRREEAFVDRWRAGTRSRQAQSRLKRLARLKSIEEPDDQSRLAALDLRLGRRLGDLVLEVLDLEIGFPGRSLAARLNFQLEPGEIIGVVGPNGSGKSTRLQTFMGAVSPLAGTFRWGPTAQIGHLGQHESFPNEAETPLRYLQNANLGADDQDRRDKLGAMLFSGDEAVNPIHILSGGEKKRLMLTRLLLEGDNVLLLDEPTNHLDIDSAEAVTLALSAYPGSVIAVSHDRRFLDDLADRVLWLEEGDWQMTRGSFSQAEAGRDRRREKEAARRRGTGKGDSAPGLQERKGTGRRGGAETGNPFAGWSIARLERRIMENEDRLAGIHAAFTDSAIFRDGGRMRELRKELAAIEKEQALLEEEYARRG